MYDLCGLWPGMNGQIFVRRPCGVMGLRIEVDPLCIFVYVIVQVKEAGEILDLQADAEAGSHLCILVRSDKGKVQRLPVFRYLKFCDLIVGELALHLPGIVSDLPGG